MSEQQDYKNHARLDPLFHFVILPIFGINLVGTIVVLVLHPGILHAWIAILAFAFLALAIKARQYASKVQDRVIRLEERLRLQALAPQELHAQLAKLTEDQLIALRFAPNDEIVELAKQALEQNLNRKQIKELIKNWRPDNWRI